MSLSARQRPGFVPQDLPWTRALLVSVVFHATLLWGTTTWWHKTYRTFEVQPQIIEVEVIERTAPAVTAATAPELPQQAKPSPAAVVPVVQRSQPTRQKARPRQQPPPIEQVSAAVPAAQVATPPSLPTGTGPTPEVIPHGESSVAPTKDRAVPRPAVQNGQANDVSQAYQRQLKELIEKHKQYPLIARRGKQQGQVLVEFSLSQAGELISVEIAQSSGYRLLDRAALKAVSSVAAFPAPPTVLPMGTPFRIAISFVLE